MTALGCLLPHENQSVGLAAALVRGGDAQDITARIKPEKALKRPLGSFARFYVGFRAFAQNLAATEHAAYLSDLWFTS